MKSYEKILRYLLDVDNSKRSQCVTYEELSKLFFKGNIVKVEELINYLVQNGYIKVSKSFGNSRDYSVLITDLGRAYFISKKEESKAKLKTYVWDIVKIIIGAIIGYLLNELT